jgi:hypothetical protein
MALVTASVGIIRSFGYVNWVSEDVRRVAHDVREILEHEGGSSYAVVESVGSWGDQAIEVVVGFPDRVAMPSGTELAQAVEEGLAYTDASVWVLRDPATIGELLPNLEIERTYGDYTIARPALGRGRSAQSPIESGWYPTTPGQFMVVVPPDQIVIGFDGLARQERDSVGISRTLAVEPNGCYILEMEVRDYSALAGRPWVFLQQLAVNGIVLWSHDIANDAFEGWQRVAHYIMPTGDTVSIELRIRSLAGLELSEEWRRLSRLAVREFRFTPCP